MRSPMLPAPRACPAGRFASLAAALTLLGAAAGGTACSEYADLPTQPDTITAVDTAPPTGTILVQDKLQFGDTIAVEVKDDGTLGRAVLIILDDTRTVLWHSDTIALRPQAVDTARVILGTLPDDFPYGVPVGVTAWVADSLGHARYVGTTHPDSLLRLDAAAAKPVTVYEGRSLRLPSGSTIGDFVYAASMRQIYFTDTPHNAIRALSLDDLAVASWAIPVGSQPRLLAFQEHAWGAGPTLVAFNSGGTDVSVVDLTTHDGGQERMRIIVPLTTVLVGPDTLHLQSDARSLLYYCPAASCTHPVLYVSSAQSTSNGAGGRAITRTFTITDPNPYAHFDVLTPQFQNTLTSDEAVTVQAIVRSRETGRDSLIFTRSGVSKCGTLAFGSTVIASSEDPAGPVFIGESGQQNGACGPGGRVLRFDRQDSTYVVAAAAIVNYDADHRVRGVTGIAVNADASLVLLQAADKVFLTDGTLRLLGTIPAPTVSAVAFLQGQRGGPASAEAGGLFALARDDGIHVYESEHFTEVTRFTTRDPIAGRLLFVPTDSRGDLLLIGPNKDGTGFVAIPTSLGAILARAAR